MSALRRWGGIPASIAIAAVLAFLLAMLSAALYDGGQPTFLRWLPNVGLVLFAFSTGRRPIPVLLLGHAAGLAASQALVADTGPWVQVHHVLTDLVEASLMLGGMVLVDRDGRLRKSSHFVAAGVLVVLLPPVASSLFHGIGQAWLTGSTWVPLSTAWIAAGVGTASIVLGPWLVWRSRLIDAPLARVDARGRAVRLCVSGVLATGALAWPLLGHTADDALVALVLLIATTWLPVRLAAVLFMVSFALHDASLREALGASPHPPSVDGWHELRACVIGFSVLYVRLLLAEGRLAMARVLAERHERLEEASRFGRLLDQVDGVLWEADPETADFLFVSAAAERLVGYPPEAWLAPGFWLAHMHPEDRAWAPEFCAVETSAGRPHAFEYRFLHRDGGIVWLRDVVTLRTLPDGTRRLAGVMVDVTASRQAIAELREAKASLDRLTLRHRLALTAGGIGIWEVDLATGVTDWDEMMYRLFDCEGDDAKTPRQLMRERLAPESLARARAAMARMRSGADTPYTADYTLDVPGGEAIRLRSVVAPAVGADGRRRLVGATWDCSMEYLAAEALRVRVDELASVLQDQALQAMQARTAAERAEATQSDLLANVSHELRTPLHAILGFIDLVREDLSGCEGSGCERALWKLERATRAAKRLVAQVDDLLDLAKLESGAVVLRRQPVEVASLLRAIHEELAAMLVAKGLEIRITLGAAGNRPLAGGLEGLAGLEVEVDELRILQVLRNVLANAVRFSPEGGRITIDVEPGLDEGRVLALTIADEGPGVPEDQLGLIFGKFVQARDVPRDRVGGTGLGLPIAREIARAHGGELRAMPSAAGGRFILTLPRHRR